MKENLTLAGLSQKGADNDDLAVGCLLTAVGCATVVFVAFLGFISWVLYTVVT